MASRLRRTLFLVLTIIVFLFTSVIASYGESATYVYDELNRLIQIRYGGGTVINYSYDQAGNRIAETIPDTTPPTTTASPAGGVNNTAQSVTLTCNDGQGGSGCDKIYYTTGGTTPTTSSSVYSSPINISVTTTLKFFSADAAGNNESVKTQIYTIDTTPPTTTPSSAGGVYNTAQSVTLTCNDGQGGSGCDKIYYTTDGITPTTSSSVYSSPITISVTTTLKFFARDLAGNSSAVKSEAYTISTGTSKVTVQLKDSAGNPLRGGVVQYYSGGWRVFGTTGANGQVSREMRPGSYRFRMTYAFAHQEKSQDTAVDPTVVFQTVRVTVQLKDSTGALIDTGTVRYRSTGWHNMGRTSGGQVSKELLPARYTFRMTYASAHQEKSQDIAGDPTVVFQTTKVTVQLKDSTGAPMDTGSVQYRSRGWHTTGRTSGGQASKELLPGRYTLRMTYAFAHEDKSQDIAADSTVVFQTGQVHSDSGRCTHYNAGGWHAFTQDMQLLPGTYTFRYKDRPENRSYRIIAGTVNHIH